MTLARPGSLLLLLQLSLAPAGLSAQAAPPSRDTPLLLRFPSSVRGAGLAGAGVALPGYAAVLFVNPAGIAPIRVLSLEAGFAGAAGFQHALAAAALRTGKLNLGTGFRYLRFPADSSTASNLAWTGALVYRRGGISLGTGTSYFSVDQREGNADRALSGALALQVAFFDIAALALSLEHLATWQLDGAELRLPRAFHLGFSFNLLDTYSNGRLLATLESSWTAGERRRTLLGLEAGAVVAGIGLVARAGSGRQPGLEGGLLSHPAVGGSVLLGRARLDYAYQRDNAAGSALHWFGARWTP